LGDIIVYLGGAMSGKSRAAMAAAGAWAPPRGYLATAQALDWEMEARILAHQAERGPEWVTLEAPIDPAAAMAWAPSEAPILLDCLTLWLTNLLAERGDRLEADPLLAEVDRLAAAAAARPGPTIMVGNEVGGGLVPMDPLSRFFRDVSGLAHQRLAARAASVFLVAAGLPLRLK
jgi:adenosylcobinamide kinase/adenosylcobinamide-phosphate guanylyltransferase